MIEFTPFPKLSRLNRNCTITEKIDGTNASVYIVTKPIEEFHDRIGVIALKIHDDAYEISYMYAGSRTRWIQPGKKTDNMGFAQWVADNSAELFELGEGQHFGEWWGQGIQRKYGLNSKRFSLFNSGRWADLHGRGEGIKGTGLSYAPECCHVVPILFQGDFSSENVDSALIRLRNYGSVAAPSFMKPEGIVVYHAAARKDFKVTIENDGVPKGSLI